MKFPRWLVPSVGSGKQLKDAFNLKVGDVSTAQNVAHWLVYRVEAKNRRLIPPIFEKAEEGFNRTSLNEKRGLAYEAFRSGLEERLEARRKLKLMPEKLKGFGDLT